MADFQNRIFDVFSSGFLHRTSLMFLLNGFLHVFGISRIFGVFSSGFLHRTTLMFLQNGFSHIVDIFNF